MQATGTHSAWLAQARTRRTGPGTKCGDAPQCSAGDNLDGIDKLARLNAF